MVSFFSLSFLLYLPLTLPLSYPPHFLLSEGVLVDLVFSFFLTVLTALTLIIYLSLSLSLSLVLFCLGFSSLS